MRAVSSLSDGSDASPEGWLWTVLPEAAEISVVSAFLTMAGLELIETPLRAALLGGAEVLVVTGGRRDQVDARALEALLALEREFTGQLETYVVPAGTQMLTAKSYGVRTRDQAVHAWLGSANVTRAGLSRNLQSGVVFSARQAGEVDFAAASKILADNQAWRAAAEAVRLTTQVKSSLQLFEPGQPKDLGTALEAFIDYLEARAYRDTGGSAPEAPPGPVESAGPDPSADVSFDPHEGLRLGAAEASRIVPTGFVDLDNLLQGLQPGQLYLIAGETGVGKSVLARDFARAVSLKAGHPALVMSMQSNERAAMQAICAAEARIPLQKMAKGIMDDSDWTRFAAILKRVADAPLHLSHQGRATVEEIRRRIREVSRLQDRPVAMVVVDSISSLVPEATRRFANREQEVAHLAISLKALAIEEQVAVVATSGLARGPQYRSDKRPVLWDVRDSTQVVESADTVILIHREDFYEPESQRAGEADLIIAKSRNSPTSTSIVAFQGHYSRFVDMAR